MSSLLSKGFTFVRYVFQELQLLPLCSSPIDLNVGKYLNKKKNLKIVGPEIIELLQEFSDWKLIVSELKEVEI